MFSFHHKIFLGSVYVAFLIYYTTSRIEINHGKFLSIIRSNRLDISLKLTNIKSIRPLTSDLVFKR